MLDMTIEFLHHKPVLVFFIVLSVGYLIGNIKVFGISLGAVGGVLLAGLLFGHFGFTMSSSMQTMGFALFIFCVGYQAGPQFIDVLMTNGLKFFSLALVVAIAGFTCAWVMANALGLEPGMAAGLMGGAITSTPTLAAAQDTVRSGIVELPTGYTEATLIANIGAAYALTYLFGLIGLILIIRLLPKILGINLPAEANKLMKDNDPDAGPDMSHITRRTYRIIDDSRFDTTVVEMERRALGKFSIVGIRREGDILEVENSTRLKTGDEILIIGDLRLLLEKVPGVAEEIADQEGLSVPMITCQVVVSSKQVAGKTFDEIDLPEHLEPMPLEVRRQRTVLPMSPELRLRYGDIITVYGPEQAVARLVRLVGHVERDMQETDLFTFALGVAGGIGIGALSVTLGGVTIAVGMAGGLLVTGLLVGFLRSVMPVFGRVPSAARWLMMELGLLMFMAGVGINAGGNFVEILKSSGAALLGAGVVVTLVPVLVGYFFSRKVLNLNPAEALGGVAGAMTSGAALKVVTDAAESNVPALGYTGAYAFANVILTLAGTLMMIL